MTTKVYLVVAWGSEVNSNWYPWLKNQLESKPNTQVTVLEGSTQMEVAQEYLNKHIDVSTLDEHTYFIGHSVGCQQIMRWLASLNDSIKIGGVLLVAGWLQIQQEDTTPPSRPEWLQGFITSSWDKLSPWLTVPFDGKKTAARANKIVVLVSDNDQFTWKWNENKIKFEESIPGVKVVVCPGLQHFNNKEEPEVLVQFDELLKTK